MAAPKERTGDDIIVSVVVDVVLTREEFSIAHEGFDQSVDYADELADNLRDTLQTMGGYHTVGVRIEAKAGPRTEPSADGRPAVKARDSYGRQYLFNRETA